ncbi:hypothetical protein JW826_04420 [Candidatus Woesearchaeota archaeon]|nr:hypothetical protein [Candidatus Woesearchaeota archaeon]
MRIINKIRYCLSLLYCSIKFSLSSFFKRSIPDKNVKIDAVYLWADFNDPSWLRTRERHRMSLLGYKNKFDYTKNSMNELKYSLRALEKNFKNLNKIHILTDGQIPNWLNLKNNSLKIVFHKDLFKDKKHLPSYNSPTMESYVHEIPGLTEQFLCLNDDYFVNAPFYADDFFFADGGIRPRLGRKIAEKGPLSIDFDLVTKVVRNTELLLDKTQKKELRLTPPHRPQPMTKTLMRECEKRYKEAFEMTRRCHFRSEFMYLLHNQLMPYMACYQKKAAFVVNLFEKDMFYWSNDLGENLRRYDQFKKQKMFCIQEDRAIKLNEQSIVQFNNLMNKLFPKKSSFEK